MATLKAGAAQTNVTPPLGAYLAGSLKARHATEVHDELHAKALVLDDGDHATRLCHLRCYLHPPRTVRSRQSLDRRARRDSEGTGADSRDPHAHRPRDEAGF